MELKIEKTYEYDEHGKKIKETEVKTMEPNYSECEAPCDCCECADEYFEAIPEFDSELECSCSDSVSIGKVVATSLISAFIGGVAGAVISKKFMK